MSSQYVLTHEAQQDLIDIWDYIARDSPQAADQVMEEIKKSFDLLVQFPGAGHQRKDVRDNRYRFWRANRFIIAYFPKTSPLQIARIVGAARDFRNIFPPRR
jgi:plasmid stabilization system protein ParE